MRTLVIGDIHGAHRAMVQVLERAGFDRKNDRLISLGDVSDGWPDTAECVSYLLTCPHLVAIRGNHDMWTRDFLDDGYAPSVWLTQGGAATRDSYTRTGKINDPAHYAFFENQLPLFIDEQNRLYLHADFDPKWPIQHQDPWQLAWGRKFWRQITSEEVPSIPPQYPSIFLGHTPTPLYVDHTEPVNVGQVWNLDQGAKLGKKLTVMDADTKAYWQSDLVSTLYPSP